MLVLDAQIELQADAVSQLLDTREQIKRELEALHKGGRLLHRAQIARKELGGLGAAHLDGHEPIATRASPR